MTKEFQQIQFDFAKYIRDPESHPPPDGVEQRRIDIYKRLFYANIESFCSSTFKKFRAVIHDEHWYELVREFLRSYRCTTPYFREIPLEFIKFLTTSNLHRDQYPYMVELCHFDWVHLELDLAPDPPVNNDVKLDGLSSILVLSQLARLLSYRWPVHELLKISRKHVPEVPSQPTWIIAFRNQQNRVEKLISNAATVRVAEVLRTPKRGTELLVEIANEWGQSPDFLREPLLRIVKKLINKGVLLTHE